MRAYGYRTEATGYQATAGLEQMQSQQAQTAGAFNNDTSSACDFMSV
jgi:hypothetical protein